MNKSLVTTTLSFVVFAVSFAIPHRDTQVVVYQVGLLAVSGAITNWLAIYMLFERIPFLYGSGVIPARFEEFKTGIQDMVMNTFFTPENIHRFLDSDFFHVNQIPMSSMIESVDMDRIFDGFVKMVMESKLGGMLGMFGGASAIEPLRDKFKRVLTDKLKELAEDPETLETINQKIKENLPESPENIMIPHIAKLVEFRLEELTPEMVKQIVSEMIQKHLGWLVVWGGVFGALMGVISGFLQIYELI